MSRPETDRVPSVSQHPVDQLVRTIWRGRREASAGELGRIVERVAEAPFTSEASLVAHLTKRIEVEGQWRPGTTAERYLSDLRASVRDPDAQMLTYVRRGGLILAALTPNRIPEERLGPQSLPLLFVLYSVDRGRLVTGYQASSLATIAVPEDVWWLRR